MFLPSSSRKSCLRVEIAGAFFSGAEGGALYNAGMTPNTCFQFICRNKISLIPPGAVLGAVLLLAIPNGRAAAQASVEASPRERLSLDMDWRFTKGDPAGAEGKLSYTAIKSWVNSTGAAFTTNAALAAKPQGAEPGGDVAYTQPGFDDNGWRRLDLPHDWGIEGPFEAQNPGATGRLPWFGIGWYRKHFTVPATDAGRQVALEVDGAMAYATVWCNGHFAGGWPYGYSSFYLDLTPFLKPGAENVLAIRLDNPRNSSRWYPGGGIYRNVWLVKTGPVHVGQWGTYVTTPEVSTNSAKVNIKVTVDNNSPAQTMVTIGTQIFALDAAGRITGPSVAAEWSDALNVPAASSAAAALDLQVSHPLLWSLKQPSRYVAVTTVEQMRTSASVVVDEYETPFGIRTIKFTTDNGFLLNGERVPLNGVCNHADLGALGSVVNMRGLERQIELLKEMGCNAIRTSHNMPAPELLDLCDRMGMLEMDESFDCWMSGKGANDYHLLFADWHEKDLRAEVRRDRNHPSVILWSVGNEVGEQGPAAGHLIAADLQQIVHSEDLTRPVTSAASDVNAAFNGYQKFMDVFGYNYKPNGYARARASNPDLPIFGSETASTISSRSVYTFPVAAQPGAVAGGGGGRRRGGGDGGGGGAPSGEDATNHQVSSYDLYYPGWATSPDTEFSAQEHNPFVAGEFVWTGFDYLGEPTPWGGGNDPSRSSYFGIIDLAGFKKGRFYLYQAHWRPDFPMAHLLPHWTWPDRAGQVTPVHVYTSGDEAELFLNGQSLGRKKKAQYEYRLRWDDVVYQPGTLRVVAYKNGKEWATDEVQTAGAPAALAAKPDRSTIRADGQDLSFVTITVADAKGVMAPRADNSIHFDISGPGEIAATDNGDATSFESFQSHDHKAFNGLCLVIVRSTRGAGPIVLQASSPGLQAAQVTIQASAP